MIIVKPVEDAAVLRNQPCEDARLAACGTSKSSFHLTSGEAADCKAYDTLIALPDRAPDALLADKGYDADAIRADLASRNIKAVIPGRSNRRVKIDHDRELYKQRNCIERMFGRLKINRSIATRYDQLANSFLGMVHIATARYWLKFVHAA